MIPFADFLPTEEFDSFFRIVEILLEAGAKLDEEYCAAQFGSDDRHILQPISDSVEKIYGTRIPQINMNGPTWATEPNKSVAVAMIKKVISKFVDFGIDINGWMIKVK